MPVGIFLVQFQKPFPLKSLFLSVSVTSVYPGQKPQLPCLSPGLVLKLYGVRVGGGGGRAWTFIRVGTFSTVQDICLPCAHTHMFMDIQSWGNSRKQNFEEKKKDFEREREIPHCFSLCKSKVIFSQKRTKYILRLSLLSELISAVVASACSAGSHPRVGLQAHVTCWELSTGTPEYGDDTDYS